MKNNIYILSKVVPRYRNGRSKWNESYDTISVHSTIELAEKARKDFILENLFRPEDYELPTSKEDHHSFSEYEIAGNISDNLEEALKLVELMLPEKIIEANKIYQRLELELEETEIKILNGIQEDFDYSCCEHKIFAFLVREYSANYSALTNIFEAFILMYDMTDPELLEKNKSSILKVLETIYDNVGGDEFDPLVCILEYEID